jgi:response regulator RpfG family c-di-GMP phosphodiesterase
VRQSAHTPRGTHVLTWLRDEGRLTPAQYEGVLHHAQRSGERVEEALIETGVMREADLLKLLAAHYHTRFVSTERLAKADIDRQTLDRLPRALAERLQIFPVVFDRRTQSLSIVLAAPGEDDLEKQVQVATTVREVKSFVARPAAIRAAIEKHYAGNGRAFAELIARDVPEVTPLDLYDPSPWGERTEADAISVDAPTPPAAPPPPSPPMLTGTIPLDLATLGGPPGIDAEMYLETVNVLVSLLDQERAELRGHSSQVARVCRQIAERVGVSSTDRHALILAAYLHDVGKTANNYHLTALNVARYEGHQSNALKTHEAPGKLFASASLPDATRDILAHMYERFDGQGFPDRLAGKDIPYGARVLAIAETYCDLIANSRNPYRRVLTIPQALSVVRELGGQLFDPTLAELLCHVVLGDDPNAAKGDASRALLCDPDAEATTVLEMRLIERGFVVFVARDLAGARAGLEKKPHLVITEVDLANAGDGFVLGEAIQAMPEGERPAIMFLARRGDRESVNKGFGLGAADYLVKPASAEIVATKASQALDGAARRASGVSGSLKDMPLSDVVQILANGRRGGRLTITAAGKRGEIHFAQGQIYDARFGTLAAEEAFYAMLRLAEGTFALDPSTAPQKRVIHTSAEGLLLEGMRRIDEGL